jgi:hypothetical protein
VSLRLSDREERNHSMLSERVLCMKARSHMHLLLILSGSILCISPSFADSVGTAISVKTQAAVEQPSETTVLTVGASLPQDATVRTNESGNAQLKFLDETLLVIGPSSSIKLERIMFSPDRRAKKFVLNAIAGAFRFATGRSNHNTYLIETAVATIGVRGTRFAFSIRDNEVTIVVTQGTVRSCIRGASMGVAQCVNASAGNTIITTPAGSAVRRTVGAIPDALRTVLALPPPTPQRPNLRDAMQGVQPLDRPIQGLSRGPTPADPTANIPSAPSLGGAIHNFGGGLNVPGGLPNIPSVGGAAVPRVPGR